MIFPEDKFNNILNSGNWLLLYNIQENAIYEFTDSQLHKIYSERRSFLQALAELYVKNVLPLSNKQLGRFWIEYSKTYVRDGGMVDQFFKKAAKELNIPENEIFQERGAGWVISNLPSEFYAGLDKWAGVCCNSSHDKYIYAYIYLNSNDEYEFKTFYGRIQQNPQNSIKKFNNYSSAKKEFDKYVKSKERQYSKISLIEEQPSDASTSVVEDNEKKEEIIKNNELTEFKSWDELQSRFKPFIGKSENFFGEIIRAIDFLEFRAKSKNDWPHIGMNEEELDDSLAVYAIGFISDFNSNGKKLFDVNDLLRSSNKNEFLEKINIFKSKFISHVNSRLKSFGLEDLQNTKNNENMSSFKYEEKFKNIWEKLKN